MRLRGVAADFKIPVLVEPLAVNGFFLQDVEGNRTIHLSDALEPLQRAKTLAHELAHALLHSSEEGRALSPQVAEVEAESTAFAVLDLMGLDASAYSFGYVASWAKGDVAVVLRTGQRVRTAVSRILSVLDDQQEAVRFEERAA